jgi:hypothetical protein
MLVVVVFAAAVYTCFWLLERRRAGRSVTPAPTPAPGRRMVAPDDDEEFLRELERRHRRAARDNPRGQPDSGDPKGPSEP